MWRAWNAEHGNLPTIISEAGFGQEMYAHYLEWSHPDALAIYWFGVHEAMPRLAWAEWKFLPMVVTP